MRSVCHQSTSKWFSVSCWSRRVQFTKKIKLYKTRPQLPKTCLCGPLVLQAYADQENGFLARKHVELPSGDIGSKPQSAADGLYNDTDARIDLVSFPKTRRQTKDIGPTHFPIIMPMPAPQIDPTQAPFGCLNGRTHEELIVDLLVSIAPAVQLKDPNPPQGIVFRFFLTWSYLIWNKFAFSLDVRLGVTSLIAYQVQYCVSNSNRYNVSFYKFNILANITIAHQQKWKYLIVPGWFKKGNIFAVFQRKTIRFCCTYSINSIACGWFFTLVWKNDDMTIYYAFIKLRNQKDEAKAVVMPTIFS